MAERGGSALAALLGRCAQSLESELDLFDLILSYLNRTFILSLLARDPAFPAIQEHFYFLNKRKEIFSHGLRKKFLFVFEKLEQVLSHRRHPEPPSFHGKYEDRKRKRRSVSRSRSNSRTRRRKSVKYSKNSVFRRKN